MVRSVAVAAATESVCRGGAGFRAARVRAAVDIDAASRLRAAAEQGGNAPGAGAADRMRGGRDACAAGTATSVVADAAQRGVFARRA